MGRTLPAVTVLIQEFEESWKPYSRALRREDHEMLAELFAMIRFQSAAISNASPVEPFQAYSLAMLGGILKRLCALEKRVEESQAKDRAERG